MKKNIQSQKIKRLSILIPVYQNSKNLPTTISYLLSLTKYLKMIKLELVFIDDGSTDGSLEIIKNFSKKDFRIKWVKLTKNFGQSYAIKAGLNYTCGDRVVIISCDLQEPFMKITDMVQAWQSGSLFVIGERVHREEGIFAKTFSFAYWLIVRSQKARDFPRLGYDFCLIDRKIVNSLRFIKERNFNIFISIWLLGYSAVRVPISRMKRSQGKSQWNIFRKTKLVIDTLITQSTLPLTVIFILGMLCTFFSMAYFLIILSIWFLKSSAPSGWMTVVGLISLFGAFIMSALSIQSEYIKRILEEVQDYPIFIVEDSNLKLQK